MQVRRWGILWRPMEVRQKKFEHVVDAVVRLHNFCRERKVKVPTEDVGGVTIPAGVTFDKDCVVIGDYFNTVPVRSGRRAKDQVGVSKPREDIRRELEITGVARPEHNVARNRDRA